jgi:hypothetical protein
MSSLTQTPLVCTVYVIHIAIMYLRDAHPRRATAETCGSPSQTHPMECGSAASATASCPSQTFHQARGGTSARFVMMLLLIHFFPLHPHNASARPCTTTILLPPTLLFQCTHISNRSMCGHGPARHARRCSQTPRGGQCGNISWARETSASPRQRSEICFRKATWSQTPPSTESFPGTPARHSLQRMHPWSPWLPGRPSWPCGEVLSLQIVRLCASPRSGCCMQAHLSPPPVNEVEQCRGHSQRGNVLKYTEPE